MSRKGIFVALIGAALLGGTLCVARQAPSPSLEEQLRSQYRLTRVGTNGTVVGSMGSVLVVQSDGLSAIPASHGPYWYSHLDKGGAIKTSGIQHGGSVGAAERRVIQVGEKVYIVNLEINQAEISFSVQTCGNCNASAPDPNAAPYRARLAIKFDKGFLGNSNLKEIQDRIGQAFAIDTSASVTPAATSARTSSAANPSAMPVALKLPSAYVQSQSAGDQLHLNSDNTFLLEEAGQKYHGTFKVNGGTLELNIAETGTRTTATIQGDNITDSSGQTWVRREQTTSSAAHGVLQNQDIIDLVNAGLDDATILAKIGSSKCEFDTSTNALITLKQSKVSSAVIKAMVGTRR